MAVQKPRSVMVRTTDRSTPALEPGAARVALESGTSPVTGSRAVPPPTVVRNRRLVGGGVGESFLVWRCSECGAVGSLDRFPEACVCGASREALYYEIED